MTLILNKTLDKYLILYQLSKLPLKARLGITYFKTLKENMYNFECEILDLHLA